MGLTAVAGEASEVGEGVGDAVLVVHTLFHLDAALKGALGLADGAGGAVDPGGLIVQDAEQPDRWLSGRPGWPRRAA